MALLLDSPSKLLRRVQEFEDAELPSLPSFQPDLDSYGDDYYGGQRSETISDGDELSREEVSLIFDYVLTDPEPTFTLLLSWRGDTLIAGHHHPQGQVATFHSIDGGPS